MNEREIVVVGDLDARMAVDVYLVDATAEDRLRLVARLASDISEPVVVIGDGKHEEAVRYLDAGAADYILVSVSDDELAARLRRWRRVLPQSAPDSVVVGPLMISVSAHEVQKRGEIIRLTRNEFLILHILLDHLDQTVTSDHLIRRIWGSSRPSHRQYVRAYIAQLRLKIEDRPEQPTLLVNERGVGYRLQSTEGRGQAASSA